MISQTMRSIPSNLMSTVRMNRFVSSTCGVSEILADLASGKTRPESNKVSKLQHFYANMKTNNKHQFLVELAADYSIDVKSIPELFHANGLLADDNVARVSMKKVSSFRESLTPKYEVIFSNIARENGLTFLLRLRADLLGLMGELRKQEDKSIQVAKSEELLAVMDTNLKKQLTSWFSVGFLHLKRITYEGSSGGVLEKIARYETVHKVRGLYDLKARLGPGRRCYALFHPCVPDEPLVFVHVALVPEIADSMSYIHKHSGFESVHHHDAKDFDVFEDEMRDHELTIQREQLTSSAAIFYSINSTQPGLRGVELGNYLIKRVAKTLSTELPNIHQFCTLSPIPGFMRWLKASTQSANVAHDVLQELSGALGEKDVRSLETSLSHVLSSNDHALTLANIVSLVEQHPYKIKDCVEQGEGADQALKRALLHLGVHYLTQMKKGNESSGISHALDPVANFHLRNGAMLHRVNWGGDLSTKGLQASAGMMANYLYELAHIEERSEKYEEFGEFDLGVSVRK